MPLNPYIAGPPVSDPNAFFGREEVFRDVMHMLRNPHNNAIVLYGQRRIGKTSVLLQLKNRLAEQGEFTPIYFDLQDKAAKALSEVLYELAHQIASVTGQDMPNRSLFDDNGEFFRNVFLPAAATAKGTGGLVLLFDEFDVLEDQKVTIGNQAGQAFFPYLRTWMAEQQKVKFYIVIGRRPEELSTNAISAFKGVRASRISLLRKNDHESVIRQSEHQNSLFWTDAAIDRIWNWTQGHTYLTQLLCSVIWEYAYDIEPTVAPRIEPTDVDNAIEEALKQGQTSFLWIWGGLPPAERVVMAAMAETNDEIITKERLIEILNSSGVRLILRELELAPETLVEWGLLREVKDGYCFVVPLLRRWVAVHRPLTRVKDELDRIDKHAESLFQAAQSYFGQGLLADAELQLKRAIDSNPNHLKAMLLLGKVLFEGDRIAEAVKILQLAYDYDQSASKAELIKVLLILADRQFTDHEKLYNYERVLVIDPKQPIAREERRKIWMARGEASLKYENFDEAIDAFENADDKVKVEQARKSKRFYEFKKLVNTAEMHEKNKNWQAAIEIWKKLIQDHKDFKDQIDFQKRLEKAESQASLEQRYNDAIQELKQGNNEIAKGLLIGIIPQEPNYKEALRYLMIAIYGDEMDIANFKPYKNAIHRGIIDEKPKILDIPEEIIKRPGEIISQNNTIKKAEPLPFNIEINIKSILKKILKIIQDSSAFKIIQRLDTIWQRRISNENIIKSKELKTTQEEPINKNKIEKNTIDIVKTGESKLFLRIKPILIELQNLSKYIHSFLKKWIYLVKWNKIFKNRGNWAVSSLIWLPLLVWSIWFWQTSTIEMIAKFNFRIIIFLLMAWLLTTLIGHLGKLPKIKIQFNFQQPKLIIIELTKILLLPLIIIISSIIIAKDVTLMLGIVLVCIAVALWHAWKHAGIFALIIASVVSIGVAISIRSTMDLEARRFGQNPYLKSRNAMAQVFIKKTIASMDISSLMTLSNNLKEAMLKDNKNNIIEYALLLSDRDSLNDLRYDKRFAEIFDDNFLHKATQQLYSDEATVKIAMATFLRKLPMVPLPEAIFNTFDFTRNNDLKRLCLFILDGNVIHMDYSVKQKINLWVQQKQQPPELTDAFKAINLTLNKVIFQDTSVSPNVSLIPPGPSSSRNSPQDSSLSLQRWSDSLKVALSLKQDSTIFYITKQLVKNPDSLKLLSSKKWYRGIYDKNLFDYFVKRIKNIQDDNSVIVLLAGLQDEMVLQPIFNLFSTTKDQETKIRCLKIVEGFAASSNKNAKSIVISWLKKQLKDQNLKNNMDKVYNELLKTCQIFKIEPPLPIPMPSIQETADSLNKAIRNDSIAVALKILHRIAGDDSLKHLKSRFDDDFFSKAVYLLYNNSEEDSKIIAGFLNSLNDHRVINPIYNEFLSKSNIEKSGAKLRCLEILEGFTSANWTIQRDIKTWLGITYYFEPLTDVAATIKNLSKKFMATSVHNQGKIKQSIENINQKVLAQPVSKVTEIADAAIALADVDSLRLIKSNEFFKKEFYLKAFDLLNEEKWISQSVVLFLCQLQNENGELRKQIKNSWKDKISNIDGRLVTLIVLGVTKNYEDDDSKWLEKKLKEKLPEELVKSIDLIKSKI